MTAVADIPGTKQRAWFLPLFLLSYLGVAFATLSAGGVSIPLRLAVLDPANKTQWLSMTAALGGIALMAVTPPLGRLSDGSAGRFGIRRPYIVAGAVIGSAGMLFLSLAPSAPAIVAGWILTQVGFASASVALNALIADQIPSRIRARVAAAFGLATTLGPLFGSVMVAALPGQEPLWFLIPVVAVIVSNAGLVLVLRDIVRTERVRLDVRTLLASYWVDPRRHPNFAWAWLCRFLVTMSMVTVATYLLYYLIDVLGMSQQEAAEKFSLALGAFLVASAATTLVAAWISDRTGRRKTIVWTSAAFTGAGLAILLVAPTFGMVLVAIVIAGMGQGAYISVDVALMTEVLPADTSAGKDLGVVALAYQLPQVLAPLMAAPLMAIGGGGPNYFAVYVAAAALSVLGALAVLPVKGVR